MSNPHIGTGAYNGGFDMLSLPTMGIGEFDICILCQISTIPHIWKGCGATQSLISYAKYSVPMQSIVPFMAHYAHSPQYTIPLFSYQNYVVSYIGTYLFGNTFKATVQKWLPAQRIVCW